MRQVATWAAGLALVLGLAACTMGGGGGTRAPSASTTSGPPADTVPAFQSYSGLTVPASADGVTVQATTDAVGETTYRVGFRLPTAELDRFCQDGQMNRPLRIRTIPDSVRTTFGYQGDGATGVALAEAGLPGTRVQREVFAVGTKTPTAQVQVHAYAIPR